MTVYPSVKFNYCCSDYVNSYVIDVNGDLYKCWNNVGDKNEKCGSIFDQDFYISQNFLNWIEWNPLTVTKCKECKVLPICMGGCPDIFKKSPNKNTVCDTIKYNLDNVIEFYYRCLKDEVKDEV